MKKIGVTCTSIFHYIHFKYIAEELSFHGYDVEYVIFAPRHTKKGYELLRDFLIQEDVNYCDPESLFIEGETFAAILAPHFMPGFQLLDSHIKKIRVLYGYAKDSWNYAEWNKSFDLILSYGPYAEKRLLPYAEVANIGHPRYRNKYNLHPVDINGNKFMKPNNKKVLLYCPTWTKISSLERFMENISYFSNDFFIIVKLHHGDNSNIWKSLIDSRDIMLFDDQTDLFDLLYNCDVVLSDYSGAIFDAMVFRKPIVLIDVVEETVLDTGIVNVTTLNNIIDQETKTQENQTISLDIAVRNRLPHARDLRDILELLKQSCQKIQLPYEDLLPELYSFEDNLAPKRAVKEIVKLLDRPISTNMVSNKIYKPIDTKIAISFFEKNKDNHLVIWGAGELGQIAYAWMKKFGYDIECFYDMDILKQGKEIGGKVIRKPNMVGKILIAVANYHKEIAQTLSENAFVEGEDYIYPF